MQCKGSRFIEHNRLAVLVPHREVQLVRQQARSWKPVGAGAKLIKVASEGSTGITSQLVDEKFNRLARQRIGVPVEIQRDRAIRSHDASNRLVRTASFLRDLTERHIGANRLENRPATLLLRLNKPRLCDLET